MEDLRHYKISAGVRVTELEHKLNYPFPTGDYVTLGGFINHRLRRIAQVGDRVQLEGACLEVLKMDRHQIVKVLFELQEAEAPEEPDSQKEENPAATNE
jgi:putative hemolysin